MRVLLAIKAMNNPGGGAERVLAELASGLTARGYEVAVLTFDPPGGRSYYPLHPAVRRIELGIGDTTRSASIGETARRTLALRSQARAVAPDVAVGFMHSMFISLGLALLGTGIPLIASEHIVPEHYRTRPLQSALLRLTPLVAERITVVSDQVLASYPPSLRARMVAIANPVSVEPGQRADVGGERRNRKTLLCVGRFSAQKDHATLIAAFAWLAGRFPDWDLRLVGDGELRGALTAQVAALNLAERVQMPGVVRDLSAEYTAAQLFVLPSRYESFGLATAEALAHGLPAVGFADCAGTNELIRPGVNGALATVDEPAADKDRAPALAAALEPLMASAEARLSLSRGEDALPSECTLPRVLDRWETLLRQVRPRRR